MKKLQIISKSGLVTLWVLCLLYQHAQAQTPNAYTGMWEGDFMEQFKTVILLDQPDGSTYSGKILMYSGEDRIQDDKLSKISIENNTLTFYIENKESSFEGTFNETITEISGIFIFPDNTEHPLTVRRIEKDTLAENNPRPSPSLKDRLNYDTAVEELKSDFKDVVDKLKKYHPRLYSYTSEEAFNEKVSETLNTLDREMTLEEFYLEIAPLVASVQCSHTGIRLPAIYNQYISESGNFLPLDLYILGDKAFSLSMYGPEEPGLIPGSEILSINGRPVDQIIDELLSIIPAEGDCQTTKYNELNRNFHTYIYLLDHSETFEVQYTASLTPQYTVLEACNFTDLKGDASNGPSMLPVRFYLDSDPDMGVLEVKSFGIGDMEGYFALLDSTFQMLEREEVPYLVIDLRDNSGGHPIFAAQLFSYLTDHEFTYFKRNPEVEDFEPLYNPMQANPYSYRGKVFVLVNGGCLSTTGHLISLLKYHTDALFIGEEPGSTFSCNDFSIQFTLPNTGIEMNIPRTTFETDVGGFKEGDTFPLDYRVQLTLKDQIDGVDSYMSIVQTVVTKNMTKL